MELPMKQSGSFGRVASVDVSQLDKINAIPNKTTDNILMDNLCTEDKLYLNALMENDPSDVEDEGDASHSRSAWSPMVHSPVVMNKRIKKLRPAYAVTLSLEDISYIRPSWGISKGIRTIELNKQQKKPEVERKIKKEKSEKTIEPSYYYFLILLTFVILLLTVPTYLSDRGKENEKIRNNRISLNHITKILEVYKSNEGSLNSVLKVQFGQEIPRSLKPDICTCDIYSEETRRYDSIQEEENRDKFCFACLDWAVRANMRVYVDKKDRDDDDLLCYNIKWQSYDALLTPLVDCFMIKDDQWFGLGDLHASGWPLNELQFDWTPLITNLSAEFSIDGSFKDNQNRIELGSLINYSLFGSNGVFIGDIRSDFQVSAKIKQDAESGTKLACLSASCTDKCSRSWSRSTHLDQLRYRNNILEYRICTANTLNSLVAKRFEDKTLSLNDDLNINRSHRTSLHNNISLALKYDNSLEKEFNYDESTGDSSKLGLEPISDSGSTEPYLPEGIGLIERTIFVTSPEFIPALDGQTLRQYVDNIVKLDLKTSSILLIDNRWETYVGSLKLNTAIFPKAKLLFEILHNKGFKIILTIKPYIDTIIGISNINQLFENGRLYTSYQNKDSFVENSVNKTKGSRSSEKTLIRRRSLFLFQNETIEIGTNTTVDFPYLVKCKESEEGYCVLLDLTRAENRIWMINNIKKSNLLTSEADGLQFGGANPNGFYWDDHYKVGVSELVKNLLYKEGTYIIPQWTGDFGYIQLAPRRCTWIGLRSIVNSVLNVGITGFSLVHPGSVWGDIKLPANSTQAESFKSPKRMDSIFGVTQVIEKSETELIIRWLQVSMFLPILQFNNIAPIERYGLQELVQNLVRIRKMFVVPELKKNLPFTPLINQPKARLGPIKTPLIRPVWHSHEGSETAIADQFMIGQDILVAPILSEGLRQKDIYLPTGFWRDELREINLRGGKWLRNYPIELNEIAWFTRSRR